LEWLAEQLQVTCLEDWNVISAEEVQRLHGNTLIFKAGGYSRFLTTYLPLHLNTSPQRSTTSKSQTTLVSKVKDLFPEIEVETNYRHPEITNPKTKCRLELDVFLPSLSLAFEYQGKQHYQWHFKFGAPNEQQSRDNEKRETCNQHGITLVEVPFWWDLSRNFLADVIRQQRPGTNSAISL
jgi:hypothetical protein